MADLKIVPVTSRSRRNIENKVLELLKFVRETEVYHIAFVATYTAPEDPTLMAFYRDYDESGDYEIDGLIEGVDDMLDFLDDIYYGGDYAYDEED